MKFGKRILSCILIMTFVLAMIPGKVKASTHVLPYAYPNEANVETNNDVWVVVFGGTASPALTHQEELVRSIRDVDIFIEGQASCNVEVIINSSSGWESLTFPVISIDGTAVIRMSIDEENPSYLEVIVNLKNKTEGPLSVTRMEFMDEAGVIVLTHGDYTTPTTPDISYITLNDIVYELNATTRTAKVDGYIGKPEAVVIPSSITTALSQLPQVAALLWM